MRPIAVFLILSALLPGCNDRTEKDAAHGSTEGKDQYTCSMHPQIIQDTPGNCPICGMRLVKVSSTGISGNKVVLNNTQMILANITTAVARRGSPAETIVLNGVLTVDERKSEVISSRAKGRIETLFAKEAGRFIRKGEPLYVLYSETLVTLQQEYLMARKQVELAGEAQQRYRSFMNAAKRKLLLYGLTAEQISQLTETSALHPRVTFVAPSSGVITDVLATEGQYVAEGTSLYRLEDMQSLWVEADVYPNEISQVKQGDTITVRVSGVDEAPIQAAVTFISPEYEGNTQVTVLRAQIGNPRFRYKPGQQAQVFLAGSAHDVISLPADAVIRSSEGAHVYVQSGKNTFEPRMVKTGLEGFNTVEIVEGLEEGDTVAVTGAYLLYSDQVFGQ
jgi:Cu(I)/Ag(I) efflux system membrane fusion protein